MNHHQSTIEYDTILKKLADHALSDAAKAMALALQPYMREAECKARMAETTGARTIIEVMGTPPVSPMETVDKTLRDAALGTMLTPEQLTGIAAFLTTTDRMRRYLQQAETAESMISFYGRELKAMPELREEIERCIRVDSVDDHASTELYAIRRRMEALRDGIRGKLESMLRANKAWFSDGFVVTRGDRLALPVKKQYKQQVPGAVLDTSGSGQTVFIEPSSVRKHTDELSTLAIDEDNEVRRILYTLSDAVAQAEGTLMTNIRTMQTLDFLFAKAKLSLEMDARAADITAERRIRIVKGRHPLLDPDKCVPLDFAIGEERHGEMITGIVITGPNTGGKTVALKTVGLLTMMAQSGLHVPAAEGSMLAMQANVLCDIGDGQSIHANLSTFSAHMTNIIGILGDATHESLVLLDELGSGTDPAEGMGLAIAILEELRAIGCLFVTTSHYPEVKEYAQRTPGLLNARMAFDRESLAPEYRLEIGEAGESCALHIARRLGVPESILQRAQAAAYAGKDGGDTVSRSGHDALAGAAVPTRRKAASRIQRQAAPKAPREADRFSRGDSVRIQPGGDIGIVYQTADDQGELIVHVKGEKHRVSHKQLTLIASAASLYPPDYDLSIVFDTVSNRKARHKLDKGNPEGVIVYTKEELTGRR